MPTKLREPNNDDSVIDVEALITAPFQRVSPAIERWNRCVIEAAKARGWKNELS